MENGSSGNTFTLQIVIQLHRFNIACNDNIIIYVAAGGGGALRTTIDLITICDSSSVVCW